MFQKINILTFIFTLSLNYGFSCPDEYWEPIKKGIAWHHENTGTRVDDLGADELRPLFSRIWEISEQHKEAYHHFVTAQNSKFYALQVVLKTLYGETEGPYEYLRLQHQLEIESIDQLFECYPGLTCIPEISQELEDRTNSDEEASDDEDNEVDFDEEAVAQNDVLPEISKEIIAASLLPHCAMPQDSALYVFLVGGNVAQQGDELVASAMLDAFTHFGLAKKNAQAAVSKILAEAPKSDLGILMQVFVPKTEAKDFFFVSLSGGYLHKRADREYLDYFDRMHQRVFAPGFLPENHNAQVRLLASKLTEDDVLIYRHTQIPEEQRSVFEARVREIVDEVLNREH